MRVVASLVDRASAPTLYQHLRATAERIVDVRWKDISAVAEALMEQRKMTSAEVSAVVRSRVGPASQPDES
jgi:hypothetical protein